VNELGGRAGDCCYRRGLPTAAGRFSSAFIPSAAEERGDRKQTGGQGAAHRNPRGHAALRLGTAVRPEADDPRAGVSGSTAAVEGHVPFERGGRIARALFASGLLKTKSIVRGQDKRVGFPERFRRGQSTAGRCVKSWETWPRFSGRTGLGCLCPANSAASPESQNLALGRFNHQTCVGPLRGTSSILVGAATWLGTGPKPEES